ncbi:MAG: hypothetical protein LUH50_22935 [Bacteroides intestinalis]|nr:hypothetical protein [Bacteroides intestinalis]
MKEYIATGFSKEDTKQLTQGKTVQFTGELYSDEHKYNFKADNIAARIESDPEKKTRLRLTINGTAITDWFSNLVRTVQKVSKNYPSKEKGRS